LVYKKQNAPEKHLVPYIPPISLTDLLPVRSVYAAEAPKPGKILCDMQLVEGLSSMQATRVKDTLLIEPDPAIAGNLTAGVSAGDEDNQYKDRIISWLQARCSVVKKESWRIYIPDNVDLISLSRKRGDIVVGLMPTPVEYKSFTELDQDLVRHWVITYVGQWNPRLRLTIDNTGGSEDLVVTGVEYDVTGLLKRRDKSTSAATLDFPCLSFELPYDTGKILLPLTGQSGYVNVPKGNYQHLDIVFKPDRKAPAAPAWKGILSFVTNRGKIRIGWIRVVTYNSNCGGL
jgi:hypothetical protein